MNSDLSPPIKKNPEPLAVPQLQTLFVQAGIDLREWEMFWTGIEEGFQVFRLTGADGVSLPMKVMSFLSEDEKIIFRAFQDWFAASMRKVSDAARGYYTFDVLQYQIGDAPWSWNDFTALLTAHAKKLAVGERKLIQFGSLWGVLYKRTEAEFGRVESKLHLDFCKPAPEAVARFIKKQSAKIITAPLTLIVFRDLSRTPLCPNQADFELLTAVLSSKEGSAAGAGKLNYWHPASKLLLRV